MPEESGYARAQGSAVGKKKKVKGGIKARTFFGVDLVETFFLVTDKLVQFGTQIGRAIGAKVFKVRLCVFVRKSAAPQKKKGWAGRSESTNGDGRTAGNWQLADEERRQTAAPLMLVR